MSKRSKKLDLVVTPNGDLLINAAHCGIHALIIAMGEVPVHFFGKSRNAYVLASDALEWHQNELQYTKGEAHALRVNTIEKFKEILEAHRSGEIPLKDRGK